jgi:hypothetical protein
MAVCHIILINSNQNINQLMTGPVNLDLESLQMEPTCQESKYIVYTINHTPSLYITKVRNLNRREKEICTWLMHIESLAVGPFSLRITCTEFIQGGALSFLSSPFLPSLFAISRRRRRH